MERLRSENVFLIIDNYLNPLLSQILMDDPVVKFCRDHGYTTKSIERMQQVRNEVATSPRQLVLIVNEDVAAGVIDGGMEFNFQDGHAYFPSRHHLRRTAKTDWRYVGEKPQMPIKDFDKFEVIVGDQAARQFFARRMAAERRTAPELEYRVILNLLGYST